MGHIEMVKLKSEYSRGFPKTTLRELVFAVTNFRGRLFWERGKQVSRLGLGQGFHGNLFSTTIP